MEHCAVPKPIMHGEKNMSITCPACGKMMAQITNTHVKKKHPEFLSLMEFRSHYNITKTWSTEVTASFVKSQTGKKRGPYEWTEKAKESWSRRAAMQTGDNHWNYGNTWSDSSKDRIREGMNKSPKWQKRLEFFKTEEYKEISKQRAHDCLDKWTQARVEKNTIIPPDYKEAYAAYCRIVIGVTRSSFNLYNFWIDPDQRYNQGWQIDHMFSKQQGFLQNINPILIGGAPNLMMLPKKMNRHKWIRSSISIDDLMQRWSLFLSRGHGRAPKAHKYWESQAEHIIISSRLCHRIGLDLYHLPDDLTTLIPDIETLPIVKP